MNVMERKATTYRLTRELDKVITEQARKLGISKNAFVQKTLTEILFTDYSKPQNEAVNQ